jgi:hypothetical protein
MFLVSHHQSHLKKISLIYACVIMSSYTLCGSPLECHILTNKNSSNILFVGVFCGHLCGNIVDCFVTGLGFVPYRVNASLL